MSAPQDPPPPTGDPRTLKCHCGAVVLELRNLPPLDQASHCDCSFCRRRAAATLSVALEDLTILRGHDALRLYSFNTGTAQHYFCGHCGIYTHHRRRIDPTQYGVNLGAIEGVNPATLEPLGWHDGINHPSDRADRTGRDAQG